MWVEPSYDVMSEEVSGLLDDIFLASGLQELGLHLGARPKIPVMEVQGEITIIEVGVK